MLELRQHSPLSGLLRLAGLPRSTFYYQQKALPIARIFAFRSALHEYIGYYNVDRIKLGLKGLSPVAFRMQAAMSAT